MEITFQKALEVMEQGDLTLAREMFETMLKNNPNDSDCLHSLARIDLREYKLQDAEQKILQSIKQDKNNILYRLLLAEIFYERQQFDELKTCCEYILEQDQNTALAYNLLGLMELTKTNYDNALKMFLTAMKLETPNIHAMKNYALTLHRIGENILAEKYSRLILRLEPDNLEAKFTLGMSLRCQGELDKAKEIFYALKELPKAQFNYGHIQLMQNNLQEGLENFQAWKKIVKPHQDLIEPEWNGSVNLDKKLLIVTYQGLGDSILMSRFFTTVKKYFKKIIIQTDKPLIRLIQSIDQEFEVIESLQDQKYDLWCDVMDLPYKLGIKSIDQIPQEPWFHVEPKLVTRSDEIKVGINWAGNPLFQYDRVRSTSLDTFSSLFEIPGVSWYSLHKGCCEDEAEKYNLQTPLDDVEDFYDTAKVIQGLDLVISTETAIPNLAAALDIPTCVISNQDVDWRWDAWYQSAEAYRQEIENDWNEPVNRSREILESMVKIRAFNFTLEFNREHGQNGL